MGTVQRHVTVVENIPHPDHENVVGDLVLNTATNQYFLLEYRPETDNYVRYSVPHKWASRQGKS